MVQRELSSLWEQGESPEVLPGSLAPTQPGGAEEEWNRVSPTHQCGAWTDEPKARMSRRCMLGPSGADTHVGVWEERQALARFGAENRHDEVPETLLCMEKGLWHIIREVEAAQGMLEQ